MQQFAEIIVGMTPEQVLALVPDPLPSGNVTIAVPDSDGTYDEKRGGFFTGCEFEVSEGETRSDFADRIHMSCCDWVYDVNSPDEPPPSPEFLEQLSETAAFQALFQFQFEEAVNFRRSQPLDLYFQKSVHFNFAPAFSRHVKGQFHGDVEVLDDAVAGETSGTFRLSLADGAHNGPAAQAIEGATLHLKIKQFPGLHAARPT